MLLLLCMFKLGQTILTIGSGQLELEDAYEVLTQ